MFLNDDFTSINTVLDRINREVKNDPHFGDTDVTYTWHMHGEPEPITERSCAAELQRDIKESRWTPGYVYVASIRSELLSWEAEWSFTRPALKHCGDE